MKVKDVIIRRLFTVRTDTLIKDIARILSENNYFPGFLFVTRKVIWPGLSAKGSAA
jgi:predicted transcriptional regulator